MRLALFALLILAVPAHAEPTKVKSTTLTLGKVKAKPARLLANRVTADVTRSVTPCILKVVVEPQHPLFKRFAIELGFEVNATGAIKNGSGPLTAEIKVAGASAPFVAKTGRVEVTRKKSHDFDAKLTLEFEHEAVPWTLSGTVRVENAACLWDVE